MPRLRFILLQILLFVAVTLAGMLPYWVARLVFRNESFYYKWATDPRFRWFFNFVETMNLIGPIPNFIASVVLGGFALHWFNRLNRPKIRE